MRWILLTLVALGLFTGCHSKPGSPYPVRSCSTTIRYAPDAGAGAPVGVAGEWSGFSTSADRLYRQSDGSLSLTLTLDPRDYGYDFVWADGGLSWDPATPYTRWVGGVEHSRLTVPDCTYPALELSSFATSPAGAVDVLAQYLDGSGQLGPNPSATGASLDGSPLAKAFDSTTGRFTIHATGLTLGKHTVLLSAADQAGHAAQPIYLPFWIETTPFDWRDAVLYDALTDRFRDGDPTNNQPTANCPWQSNYQGGDFLGLKQAIDEGYFDHLGVNAIWITPLDSNPDDAWPGNYNEIYTGYHGYWPAQPNVPNKRFGTMADLKAMTASAHQHGIRILGDLVVNHVHQDHPYYQQHKLDGWFATANACICGTAGCDWNDPVRSLTCWFTPYLPTYDWTNSSMCDQFVSDTLQWVQQADLDGFRIDAVKQVQNVAVRTVAGRLHDIGAQTGVQYYLVGETYVGASDQPTMAKYIGPRMLNGQLDYPLHWPMMSALANGGPLTGLDQAVVYNEAYYAPGTLNAPFLDNADLPRFISVADGDISGDPGAQAWSSPPPATVTNPNTYLTTKYALAFLLTQPGVPLLYYGDELGLPGAGDPDSRRFMPAVSQLAAQQADLLAFTQRLGQARAQSRALRRGARTTLDVENDFYVYQRDDDQGKGAIVAINRASTPRSGFRATLVGHLGSVSGTWPDAMGGASATLSNGAAQFDVGAQGVAIYLAP